MARLLKWGILGTGGIAKKFAQGLPIPDIAELAAVGSRELAQAERFVAEFGGRACGSYQEVLDDPNVEAVYISLPHHLHYEWTVKCAEAGKHILCEKPFTLNAKEAALALDAIKKADVFFMEAFMYKSHPQTLQLRQMLQDGVIGTPRVIHAEFGFESKREGLHFRIDPKLGGGGLMDVGCYPVSFMRMLAGEDPSKVAYSVQINETGVDGVGVGMLEFPNGLRGTFGCAVDLVMPNAAVIIGDNGTLTVPAPWFCDGRLLVHIKGREPEWVKTPTLSNVWANQAVVVSQLLDQRRATFNSWSDTMGTMRALDGLRASAGIVFDAELK